MLTELGFSVHESESGEASLRAIEAGLQPDILITDHLIPGMTPVELAHAAKVRRPAMKVLIISGFAEGDRIDPSSPRLIKPFLQSEMATALAELQIEVGRGPRTRRRCRKLDVSFFQGGTTFIQSPR